MHMVVRAAGVAIGDITGTGLNKIVVSGLFTTLYSGNDYYGSNIYFQEATTYFHGNGAIGIGILNSGTHAYEDAFFLYEGNRMNAGDTKVNCAPLSFTTFRAVGFGAPENVWLGGVELRLNGSGFEIVHDGRGRLSSGESTIYSILLLDLDFTIYAAGDFSAWFSETVAGNFNNSPIGKESVAVVAGSWAFQGPRTAVYNVQASDINDVFSYYFEKIISHNNIDPKRNICIAPIVTNDRSARVKFREKSYFFTNPNIIAVLQAAPSFSAIDYDRGTTSFSTIFGSGGTQSKMVTLSAGFIFGFEHEFSFFGLGKTGIELNASLKSNFGSGWETSKEYTFTQVYESGGDQDRVFLTMTPYTKYIYDMYVPETKMPTQEEYNNAQTEYEALLNGFDPNIDGADVIAHQIAKLAKLIEEIEKQLANGVEWGGIIPAGITDYTVSLPGSIITTGITVDRYDALAEEFGYQKIRGNTLQETYQWGNPSTYRNNIGGLDVYAIGNNNPDSWITVSNSGNSWVTRSIDITESNTLLTTSGLSFEFELILKAGGFKAGITMGVDTETGFSSTTTTGTSFAGRVSNLPITANEYSFCWNFLAHRKRIEGAEVFVLEYITKDVVQPVGIPTITSSNIKIYPNPATDVLIIENGELKIENVAIFDIIGKKVSSFQHSTNIINVSMLPHGIYLVKFETDSGVVTRKFVKN